MSDDNNIQKNLDKHRKKRGNLFCDLVCDNHMNGHLLNESRTQLIKAHAEGNEVEKMILQEQADVYLGTIHKNIIELQYLMEELGYNDINFNLN